MPGLIQANTACESPTASDLLDRTIAQIIDGRIPNLFRPFLNPHVAQACYCLAQLISRAWPPANTRPWQTFLANSAEEALSGAIKLARYDAHVGGRSPEGVLVDDEGRFEHFAALEIDGRGVIEFLPGVHVAKTVAAGAARLRELGRPNSFLAISASALASDADEIAAVLNETSTPQGRTLLIACTDRATLIDLARKTADRALCPDIVVFDESFVDRVVPFGAFSASEHLFRHWNKRGMATFHSTTFQPNTISSLHLVNCLRRACPDLIEPLEPSLDRLERDLEFRRSAFRDLYSRSMSRLTALIGFDSPTVIAEGHYVEAGRRRVFDGVGGVACSVRGHNPPTFLDEIRGMDDVESCRAELASRLESLTGLPYVTPAVSGASAVEQALKIGLACQHPRNVVLALRGGFAGKTLFALAGTWKASLKQGVQPLYPHVVYVDPHADDAVTAIELAFRRHAIGVVQFELIQGVGGVRALPTAVTDCLVRMRGQHGCLLFVDEVQTGIFRTGPFVRAVELGLGPDLLTIGKAASDMVFPCSWVLHSATVQRRLDQQRCRLPQTFARRCAYGMAVRTTLNVLRIAEEENLPERVRQRGELFARLLGESVAPLGAVREVRCYGLLIGIELCGVANGAWLRRLRQRVSLLAMLKHPTFPLLLGFCQYEPHVLKLTPPLSIAEDEIRAVCSTVADALRAPLGMATWKALRSTRRRSGGSTSPN